jgi:hypothetical protein
MSVEGLTIFYNAHMGLTIGYHISTVHNIHTQYPTLQSKLATLVLSANVSINLSLISFVDGNFTIHCQILW